MKVLLIISLLVMSIGSSFASNSTLIVNKNISASKPDSYKTYTYSENLSKKCSIMFKSNKPFNVKAGTKLFGKLKTVDREIYRDSDSIGKKATSQFIFEVEKSDLVISGACFTDGMVFPRMGLPSLEDLYEMALEYVSVY